MLLEKVIAGIRGLFRILEAMVNLRKILVTTDLSEHSVAALEYAFSFGLLYASKMYVLYVAESASLFPLYGSESDKHPHAGHVEEVAGEKLDQFILSHIGAERKVTPVIRVGVPSEEIVTFSEEEGVDLIVMATHGRTGLRHIVLGSVAEKIVRRSHIPVLTIKPKKMREDIVRAEDVELELHLK
jgi:nucleotide-binding universal stress UspA family protein